MKKLLPFILLGLSQSLWAGHAHEHGKARLEIAIEGNQLLINLESPLDNLLGFERLPRTEKEKQAVQKMSDALRQSAVLFTPSAAAQCKPETVELESPVLNGHAASDGHNDLEARYVWRCDRPEALQDLAVHLFKQFPRLHQLEVRFVGPKGQRAGRLDHHRPVFSW